MTSLGLATAAYWLAIGLFINTDTGFPMRKFRPCFELPYKNIAVG